jgi:hypothetical protein
MIPTMTKMRTAIAVGLLMMAVATGASMPASADRICARVVHTVDPPTVPGATIELDDSVPICVPLP